LEAHVQGRFSQAQGRRGNHRLDQADGERESTLGCRKDSRRTPETGHPRVQAHHPGVHEERSPTPAKRAKVEHVSAQPRRTDLGM
jgi:hypothetical protein